MDYYGQQTVSTFQQEAAVFMAPPPAMVEQPVEAENVHSLAGEAIVHPVTQAADPFTLLEAKMETMRKAIYSWRGRAEELQSTLQEREALAALQQEQILALQEEMARMQLALQNQGELLSAEQGKSAELQEQGAGYLLQLSDKEQALAEAEAKILTMEQLAIRFEVQIQHMNGEQLQLEEKLAGKEKNIADLEGYIALVEQENNALKQQLEQFTGANHQMLDRLNTMLERFASDAEENSFALPQSSASGLGLYGATAGHA
ncbi:hypothetical protein [Candidatus Magnetaquicoccus inordinatus]|uniref:hypothetical protein n=1 Tax=Candidatus Magnetaquicoccus inordinatus TaxID=2496818 RepID=UPI00102C825F|nr:hypothetical protein [Candidatus Magnetaquicoccus inordinatus]